MERVALHVMTVREDSLNKREGWAVFNADGIMKIQKLDSADRFKSDGGAVAYVANRALLGSVRHLRALYVHNVPARAVVYLDGPLRKSGD